MDEGDGGVLAREMLQSQRAHGGTVVGRGENAVVVLEVEIVFVDSVFFAAGEDGDDVRIWCEG